MFNYVGDKFISMVKSFYPTAKSASGGREVQVRCPFCGDSRDPRHGHFYISVPRSQDELSFYHCKKCPNHGILTDDVLRRLGCTDSSALIEIIKHNTEVMNMPRYKSLKQIDVYPLKYGYIRQDDINASKIDYINRRIGANFGYDDLAKMKIILNLYDVLNQNQLELTRHQMITNDLDRYFIGFISYDNSYCGMRKTTDKELYRAVNKRYINYSLIEKQSDSKNFYVIPSNFNILDPTPVKIHMAEGQFDILSIFYNLCGCNTYQNIYIACGGKSYSQALEFILTETGVINYETHYYPDSDVSDDDFFYDVTRKIQLLPTDICIHRNGYVGEKDFGVPKDRIKDYLKVIHEQYM